MGNAIIQFENITKTFGKKLVLDRINLTINRRDIFGIIGSSGGGKTTLLRILICYEKPDEGEVLFQPLRLLEENKDHFHPVSKEQKEVKRTFGFAAQDPSFYPKLTVRENMYYFASLYSLSHQDTVTNTNTLLELLDLQNCKDELAENLSGGMQKRLDIGCALIHDPQVLILDEPTADLDPLLRNQMWKLIKKINKRGTTILIASHFLEEIDAICNNIGILHGGKIIQSGSPDKIKEIYSKSDEIFLETSPGKYESIKSGLNQFKHLKITQMVIENNRLIIRTPNAERVLHDVLHILERNKEKLLDVYVAKPSLNEVFEALEEGKK